MDQYTCPGCKVVFTDLHEHRTAAHTATPECKLPTTKALDDLTSGDRIASPKGRVTVTRVTRNVVEDFRPSAIGKPYTVTVVGTLPDGKQVRLTAPSTSTVEVAL